jgi:tRNA-2-methylthio-N6-dimethylallyladenosine synthase
MTERLMDAMAEARPKLCAYLHLPVQSGSSAVLAAMRRGYDRPGYLAKIAALRSRMPDLALGTDVIVGYPTETEDDFGLTLTLLDEVGFDTVYSFTYSERPGTAAAACGDLSSALKFERLARLQAQQKGIQERLGQRWLGRHVKVLVEGPNVRNQDEWTGRSGESRVVNFRGSSAPGRLETVRIVRATAFSLRGEIARGA